MSEESRMQFISQSDVQGRLNLLRYGLIVVVVVVFIATWLLPYAALQAGAKGLEDGILADNPNYFEDNPGAKVNYPSLGDTLLWGLLAGVVTAVASVIIYFVYREILKRTVGSAEE